MARKQTSFLNGIVVLAIRLTFFTGVAVVPVMLLWNWLIPMLFSGSPITFWQSLGLIGLVQALVGPTALLTFIIENGKPKT